MFYSKVHKLQVTVLSVSGVPHPDCLGDQYSPSLIPAASMTNVSTAATHPSMMMCFR